MTMEFFLLPHLAEILYELGLHITGHHASHASERIWDITKIFLTKDKEGKPINHHLQRAARRSFLQAQLTIARDCHQALMADSPVQEFLGKLVYLPPHREELKWLDTKVKETAKQLGQLRRDKTVADEFVNRDDLESLCTPEGKLAEAKMATLRQRLIDEALIGCHSRCYQYKVETELFEQVSDRFMAAIRENPEVSRVFNARWLAQISAMGQEIKQSVNEVQQSVQEVKQEVRDLKNLLLTRFVTLGSISIDDLDNVSLTKILGELQKLTKGSSLKISLVIAGSVILGVEGSPPDIQQLDRLFKTGQLTEIAGLRVLNVSSDWEDEKPAHVNRPVNLTAWLQKHFSSKDWLLPGDLALAHARTSSEKTERGIQLNLGDNVTQSVILIVIVQPGQAEKIDITLWLYPVKGSEYLPSGLQIMVLDEQSVPVEQLNLMVGEGQYAANLGFKDKPGERFAVKLVLGEKSVVKEFEI